MNVPAIVLAVGLVMFVAERLVRGRAWPRVSGWWPRALLLNGVQGASVFLAGVAMLFIPGQGLLTMLLGLALIDFPGKRAMEIKLLRRPKINRAINWVRRKYGREPLQVP